MSEIRNIEPSCSSHVSLFGTFTVRTQSKRISISKQSTSNGKWSIEVKTRTVSSRISFSGKIYGILSEKSVNHEFLFDS